MCYFFSWKFNSYVLYSALEVLISDNGLEFVNKMMSTLCNFYNIKKVNILPYHPQGNGLAERTIRRLLDVMRLTIGNADPNWNVRLPMIQHSLNTAIHQSIKMSPYQALFGLTPRQPFDRTELKYLKQKDDNPISTRVRNVQFIHNNL